MRYARKLLALLIVIAAVQLVTYPFGKNKINYQPQQWKKLNTIHFTIYFAEGKEEIALQAARIAEAGYAHVADYLQYEPTRVIPILLYPSRVEFQNNNITQEIVGESTGGFTESLKNRIVIPYGSSFAEFRHVLVHEMVHAFQFNMLFNDDQGDTRIKIMPYRIPLWVIEGMAEYFTLGFDETTDMFMRDAVLNDRISGLANMTAFRAKNFYAYYKEGQSFFYYYEQSYGKEAIGELFRDLRDLRDPGKALAAQTGKSLGEIEADWLRFYKRKYAHLMNKKFDNEEGLRLTNHEETGSTMNLYPAVSPEGDRIAYLTNRDIYLSLVVMNIKNGGKFEQVLLQGNKGEQFEEMLARTNAISWSGDGMSLGFIAQTGGKEAVYIIDAGTGTVKQRLFPPLHSIMDPSLSPDGKSVVFSGFKDMAVDLYVYSIPGKKLQRLTDDADYDRFPKFSSDGKSIVYSSKKNGSIYSMAGDYDIYRLDLAGGPKKLLVSTSGNDIHGELSGDGASVLFSSNKSGIYNIYQMDTADGSYKKLTDVNTGTFTPRFFPDGKKIAYVNYQRLGYDIYMKDLTASDPYPDTGEKDTQHEYVYYPPSILKDGDYHFSEYDSGISPDWLALGVAGAWDFGIIGYAQASLSDLTGNHKIVGTVNYIREDRDNDFNFNLAYWYLKQRWDLVAGGFRQSNPLWLFSMEDIHDLTHSVNFGMESMEHYGGYVGAIYPFSRFFRASLTLSGARYETNYDDEENRRDAAGTISKAALSLVYDNVLWGLMMPLDGFRGRITLEQSFPLLGHDLIYTGINLDLRRYFLMYREYVLALRFSCGHILGPDSSLFQYYIGGFSTLRGYDLFAVHGGSMFLLSAEFRFTLIENLRLAWPVRVSIGNFGGVIFLDAGSAWNDTPVFYNTHEQRADDLNFDIGFGIRFVIYPVTILKLDFAWPFDRTTFGTGEILFSLGLEF